MMYGRGNYVNNGCFGYDFLGSGWHVMIMAGVLLLIIATIIYFSRRNSQNTVNSTALELLKMKFVQGEITEEEYLQRNNTLKRR